MDDPLTEFYQIMQVVALRLQICSRWVLTFELDPIFFFNLTLRPNPELGRKVGFLPGNRMDLTPLCSELGRKVHFYQMC